MKVRQSGTVVRRTAYLLKECLPEPMSPTTTPTLGQIHALLAEKGYEVTEPTADAISIRDVTSGIAIQAALEGDILFLSLSCTVVPRAKVTADLMAKMLDANNGVSTSSFQLYDAGDGKVAITLNNFCKLQEMGPDDEDDVLSCVNFLYVDVMTARRLLADLVS